MWALIILKFKVDFSKFQPTPTLDYMLKIIISSCSIILIMNSTQKMRSLPILPKIFAKIEPQWFL